MIRTDSAGVLLWEKSYGGASYDWLNSIKVTTDGGVIMCGFVYNNGGDITVNIGAIDIWIVKTDTSGNIEWEKSYGGTGNDWGFAITQSSDGGYAFAALTESNDSMVTGWHGGHDYWIVKLDSAGNLQWQKALGGAMVDECYDILETPDNGYLIAGTTNSDDGDLVQNYGLLDFNVMKVNSSGDFEWSETYGGTLTDWGMSIIADGNGDYILAGSSKSSDIDMTSNAGGWDLCLLKLTSSFNTIKGKYFYDNNNNLVFDSGDLPVTNQMVSDTGGNLISFTNINGDYRMITVDTGTFVIEPRSLNYYSTLPASHTINFPVVGQIDSLNDFSAVIIPGIYDLNVNIIPLNRYRPGFNVSYLITYSNIGTEPVNGRIVMILDTNLIYTSASITPDTVNGDTLIWSSLTLAIQESGQITVNSILDPLTLIGTNILTDAAINTPAGITDEDSLNNYSSWADDVTGSYDPNDKAVSVSKIYTNQLPNVPFLDYLIRFQNTGNDTAFTVVVRDTMSQLLDMSTFATINSSHTVEIDYQPLSRVLAFTFSNILLADSNVNEPMSHGFIHFKVKPITNLVDGDEIGNTAGIYFDFNPPVITNTAVTQILLPTRINQISDFKFGLYPNPSIGKVTVTLGENYINKKALIQIVNSLGEIVYSKSEALSKNKIDLNTSDLATGLYIVRVVIDDKTSSKQFIKQ
ncbi:MAG: T9SS type A sorting domain-containing protein [Bacteroidetes bacterium]|nr:T9SS type A sorting domain-containing protein [Bacteroidota bacterium]